MSDRTQLQQNIVKEHRKKSSQSDEEIATKLDCSASYVNQTRNEYEEEGSSGGLVWLLFLGILVLLALAETGAI